MFQNLRKEIVLEIDGLPHGFSSVVLKFAAFICICVQINCNSHNTYCLWLVDRPGLCLIVTDVTFR